MDQLKKVQMSISDNRIRESTYTSDLWGSGNEASYLGVKQDLQMSESQAKID